MATTLKISALPALVAPNAGDVLAVVDVTDTTEASSGTTKKIAIQNLFSTLNIEPAGLTFDGTSVMSHYVEGTWTPVLVTGGTVAYSTQQGEYVRIGRQVTASFMLALTANTSPTSVGVSITGLPLAAAAIPTYNASLVYFEQITLSSGRTGVTGLLNTGTTSIQLNQVGSALGGLPTPGTAVGASTILIGSVTYFV